MYILLVLVCGGGNWLLLLFDTKTWTFLHTKTTHYHGLKGKEEFMIEDQVTHIDIIKKYIIVQVGQFMHPSLSSGGGAIIFFGMGVPNILGVTNFWKEK